MTATEVFTTKEIVLLDSTEVTLYPLTINRMRKATRIWTEHTQALIKDIGRVQKELAKEDPEEDIEFDEAGWADKQFDVFVKLCALGLERELKGDKTDKQFTEYLEDTLDNKTVEEIIWVTAGIKVAADEDPNLKQPTLTTME